MLAKGLGEEAARESDRERTRTTPVVGDGDGLSEDEYKDDICMKKRGDRKGSRNEVEEQGNNKRIVCVCVKSSMCVLVFVCGPS